MYCCSVTLIVPKNMTALSNMEVISQSTYEAYTCMMYDVWCMMYDV